MRPDYGSRVYLVVDRQDLSALYRAIDEALQGMDGLNGFTVALDKSNRDVVILVRIGDTSGQLLIPSV